MKSVDQHGGVVTRAADPAEGCDAGRKPMGGAGLRMIAASLAVTALGCLVFAVFFPILNHEFVDFDVYGQLLQNPYIRGLTLDNLKHILTTRCITSYYPVRTLSFALDYQIWGLNPRGFNLTQILVHLANTLLVFGLAARLLRQTAPDRAPAGSLRSLSAAFLPACAFAVHPLVVEPVAWVAGREELLMTLGVLGCIHFHLFARGLGQQRGRRNAALLCHVLAALSCLGACLSNVVAAVTPLLITAWDLLFLPPPRFRKIFRATLVLWLIGATTIVVKVLGPDTAPMSEPSHQELPQRLMLAADVYRLNLKAVVRPTDLAIVYADARPYRGLDPKVAIGVILIGASCLLLWRARRHKTLLYGLVWFLVALGPSSHLMAHHWIRADRFLYLPLVGLAVACAAGLRSLAGMARTRSTRLALAAAASLAILLLAGLSVAQVGTWRNARALWEHCVKVSPDSPIAEGALADVFVQAGQFVRAIPHYRMAIRLDPDNKETLNNFALELATNDAIDLRDYGLAIQLAERGCEVTDWQSTTLRRTLSIACNNLAVDREHCGDFGTAAAYYRRGSVADPTYVAPLFNLALLLATCRDQTLCQPEEAVRLAERACEVAGTPDANGWAILAAAYEAAGQPEKAAAALKNARREP